MPKLICNYGIHFTEMAQKYRDTIEMKGTRLHDLINLLDEKYKGFKKELIDPATGKLATKNMILVEREKENTGPMFSLDSELRDGDILTIF